MLQRFGHSDVAQATDAQAIEAFLNDTLSVEVARRFGRAARPAVRVQIEQLRHRLAAFADHQAQLARDGWRLRTDLIEQSIETQVIVDGEPFTLTGKIDRVDEHPELGLRLLDYKTSDAGDDPDKQHRRAGRWVDLQLPLYLTLVKPHGIHAAQLGYFNLPKDPGRAGVKLAPWSEEELEEATDRGAEVIRGVRGGVYWPPSAEVPPWADPFTRVAADRALGRAELILRSSPLKPGMDGSTDDEGGLT